MNKIKIRFIYLTFQMVILGSMSYAQDGKSPFLDKISLFPGVTFPFGSGVYQSGVYTTGASLYLGMEHTTTKGQSYELFTGVDVVSDYSGGSYSAFPLLINRRLRIIQTGNKKFGIDGIIGGGYFFHHFFTNTEGIIIKNQHTVGVDTWLMVRFSPGKTWDFQLRSGILRSFTKPVDVYYGGTSFASADKFRYLTCPVLIGISRKFGRNKQQLNPD